MDMLKPIEKDLINTNLNLLDWKRLKSKNEAMREERLRRKYVHCLKLIFVSGLFGGFMGYLDNVNKY